MRFSEKSGIRCFSCRVYAVVLTVFATFQLGGCSSPLMFRVEVDEAISGGELTLNGNSARLMKNIDGAYWAKWTGADASGEIVIHYPDGTHARCRVGYVTNDMVDVQDFKVRHRKCEQLL